MAQQKSYTRIQTSDWDNDGVANDITTEKFTYKKGLLTNYLYQQDSGADGSIDYWVENTNTYKGKLLTKTVSNTDYTGDGISDSQSTTEFTYKNNVLVKSESATDSNVDGIIDFRILTENTLNKKNQIIETVTRADWDGDNVFEQADSVAFVYNKKGDVILEEHDFGNNDTIDMTVEYLFP